MLSNAGSMYFEKNQIISVICQLRFPTILAISAKEPYEFQDAIRKQFPKYQLRKEQSAPKLVPQNGMLRPEPQTPTLNHTFSSADGGWSLNLTNGFIALSAPRYTCWEDFARKLDWVLSEFFRVYQPAYFDRVGLRYVNGFSREQLGLEELPWSELIAPAFLGLLGEEDVQDSDFARCTQDAELKLRGGCRAKLHTGPGQVRHLGVQEKQPRFILDIDIFMQGPVQLPELTAALQTVHLNARNVFRSAVTDTLREAMESE